MKSKITYYLIATVVIFAGAVGYVLFINNPFVEKEVVKPLTESWEKTIPNQEVPVGLVDLKSESCGTCHTEYYEEWQYSTHFHAWTDKQFQAELSKDSSPFLCINCHIPLQNQQEFIVTGLVNGDIYRPVKETNPKFDKKLQMEGINCASCHVRDGQIIGAFETDLAPHPVKVDPIHLSETMCISCHNANAVVTPTLACTFETGDEWKAGPYFGKKNCVNCHMPEVKRSLVAGYPEREGHRHWFAGSGIPKEKGAKTKVMNGLAFYPELPKQLVKFTDSLEYEIGLKNEYAGHRMPSGDPERFVLINFKLKDAKNKLIAEDTGRIGEKWQWYPTAKKLSDNNLYPDEVRKFKFAHLPKEKGKYKLEVEVTKHRMDEEAAKYNGLDDSYPLFISVFKEKYEFEVK
jgi:nitrate reductase cytochrome c-type subunit